MVKKIWITLIMLLVLSLSVFAQQQGSDDSGMPDDTGSDVAVATPTLYAESQQGQGIGQGNETQIEKQTRDQEQEQERLRNEAEEEQVRTQQRQEVQNQIEERKQSLDDELKDMSEKEAKVYRNQNTVREAVHALLAMEGLTGGIGKNVSAIAKEFNNSVQSTIRAEERIETRSGFKRFFAGGDEGAADEIEAEVTQNQQRLQELKQLKDGCDCDEETKTMLQEQIQNMEQEQTRLKDLADKEKKSKGIFGWMWK